MKNEFIIQPSNFISLLSSSHLLACKNKVIKLPINQEYDYLLLVHMQISITSKKKLRLFLNSCHE